MRLHEKQKQGTNFLIPIYPRSVSHKAILEKKIISSINQQDTVSGTEGLLMKIRSQKRIDTIFRRITEAVYF